MTKEIFMAILSSLILAMLCVDIWAFIKLKKEKKALDTQREKCYNEYIKGRKKND